MSRVNLFFLSEGWFESKNCTVELDNLLKLRDEDLLPSDQEVIFVLLDDKDARGRSMVRRCWCLDCALLSRPLLWVVFPPINILKSPDFKVTCRPRCPLFSTTWPATICSLAFTCQTSKRASLTCLHSWTGWCGAFLLLQRRRRARGSQRLTPASHTASHTASHRTSRTHLTVSHVASLVPCFHPRTIDRARLRSTRLHVRSRPCATGSRTFWAWAIKTTF